MMLNDRWTIMNNSSSELDSKPHTRTQCCRRTLWTLLGLLIFTSVSAATLTALHFNLLPLTPLTDRFSLGPTLSSKPGPGPIPGQSPGQSPGPDPVLEARCWDLDRTLLRLEALQTSLLSALTNQESEGRGLALTDHHSGHAHQLRKEAELLRQEAESVRRNQEEFTKVLSQLQNSAPNLQTSNNTKPQGRPADCSEVLRSGSSSDGVYSVFPPQAPEGFRAFCDMSTNGGGWTVIQRREDGSVDFFRGWDAYRDGFGRTTGEHWLGLDRIAALTGSGGFELRVDLWDWDNSTAFAQYSDFSVALDSVNPEEDGFPLRVDGYSGTAGDSLLKHSGMRFTTADRDLDLSENNCAGFYRGAWWYRNCHTSNLNGQYLGGPHGGAHSSYADGIEWSSWTGWQYSLRKTEMKVRPRSGPGPETGPGPEQRLELDQD